MTEPLAELTTPEDRFTLAVWRALRDRGEALREDEVARLGAASGLDADRIARRLTGAGERDERGRLAGLGGLSVADHPHRLVFEAQTLSTWCAWDPFFLVPALGGSARLETVDPVSGTAFTVEFVDGRPLRQSGAEPVLSMVDRNALRPLDVEGAPGDAPLTAATVEDVWSSF